MPSTGVNNGTLVGIYVGGTLVNYSTNATLSLQMDQRETTSKDTTDNWREYKATRCTGTLSGDFLHAEDATLAYDDIYDDFAAGTEATIKYSSNVTGDLEYSFTGFVTSLDREAPDADNETFSATWQISGTVTQGTI